MWQRGASSSQPLHRCFVVFLSSYYHAIRARAYVTRRDATRGAMTTATSIASATVTGLPRSDDGERRAPDSLRSFSRPPSPHETFPTRTFLESLLCSCSVLSFDLDFACGRRVNRRCVLCARRLV